MSRKLGNLGVGTEEIRSPRVVDFNVWLADLTYTQQTVAADVMPQAVGGIATYVEKQFKFKEPISIFKYPEKLSEALHSREAPRVIGFSSYVWNHRLSVAFAEAIKSACPEIVVVFGGPNYPVDRKRQVEFLNGHEMLDFFIRKEGEVAFCGLMHALVDTNFDMETVKGMKLPSVDSIKSTGELCFSETVSRIRDMTDIPSPYSTGKMDEFFDGVLLPIIQTNRGCPFQCTFCVEGVDYYNKVSRTTSEKVAKEIDYIGRKMESLRSIGGRNDLFIADSNFGMYKNDLTVCRELAKSRERYGWPEYINVATGKNQKKRVLEASRIIDGAMRLSGSVQSLDPTVLKNIKRGNISEQGLMELALEADQIGANSYSEIILGLPGDSREAHFRTVRTVMEGGFTNIYLFQLMILPGTELSSFETREAYGMDTRFRILPRCYGYYDVLGQRAFAAEIEEICVSNDTLSFEDYLQSRLLHLVITIFYNDSLFSALLKFLRIRGLSPWRWMEILRDSDPPQGLKRLLEDFMCATAEELWHSREELEEFTRKPGVIERFIAGELGNNLLFVHKTRAVTEHVHELAEYAGDTVRQVLEEAGHDDGESLRFVADAQLYHRLRMSNLFDNIDGDLTAEFKYDIREFLDDREAKDISDHYRRTGVNYRFTLDEGQKEVIGRYLGIYGSTPVGIGRILSKVHTKKLFRHAIFEREGLQVAREKDLRIAGLQN